MDDSAQDAVNAALNEDWTKAVKINTTILKADPSDIGALNRLARAYAESGNIKRAISTSKKVLKLDPTNTIAAKSKDKWQNIKKYKKLSPAKNLANIFIEEPTKTKVITLTNLGDTSDILNLECGEIVQLVVHSHKVIVVTASNKYIGKLPDNLAGRFKDLIKLGNKIQVVIKCADKKEVKILCQILRNDS